MVSTEIFGFAGAIIVAIAYVPQIYHIIREHCSGGISIRSWLLWLAASLLLFFHAINIRDTVFIALQSINLIAIVIIIILIKKHEGKTCHSLEH